MVSVDPGWNSASIQWPVSVSAVEFVKRVGLSRKSGDSERPQPLERSPPKPESASRRMAAFTRSIQLSSEKEARNQRPLPGVNSRHATEWGVELSPARSMAALERT